VAQVSLELLVQPGTPGSWDHSHVPQSPASIENLVFSSSLLPGQNRTNNFKLKNTCKKKCLAPHSTLMFSLGKGLGHVSESSGKRM
jgi:hypothetical protein